MKNLIGTKIEPFKIGCREFDQLELISAIRQTIKCMSWGGHAWRTIENKALRFAVNGHHHKGHVYISLAGNDTFTVYFTSRKGTIKEIKEDIYIDMLINCIDKFVEYIPQYDF